MSAYETSSPTKRRRLSVDQPSSRNSDSSLRYPDELSEQDLQDMRNESIARLEQVWRHIEHRYGQEEPAEEDSDDEIDLDRLDEESIRRKYFRDTAQTERMQDETDSDGSEGHEDASSSSEENEQSRRHYAYFQRARQRFASASPATVRQSQRITALDLSDSEADVEPVANHQQTRRQDTPDTVVASSSSSDTEVEDLGPRGSDRSTPSTTGSLAPDPPWTPTRPLDPRQTFARLYHHMPSFSPAPTSSTRSSPSPEPAVQPAGMFFRSPFTRPDAQERKSSSPESSDSDWDDRPLATPTRENAAEKTPKRQTPARVYQPSTCERLPVSKLNLSSPMSSRRSSVLHPSHRPSSLTSSSSRAPPRPPSPSPTNNRLEKRSNSNTERPRSPYISLEALAKPSFRKQPPASRQLFDLCSSSSESETEQEMTSRDGDERGQGMDARSSTVSSDTESEYELARWG